MVSVRDSFLLPSWLTKFIKEQAAPLRACFKKTGQAAGAWVWSPALRRFGAGPPKGGTLNRILKHALTLLPRRLPYPDSAKCGWTKTYNGTFSPPQPWSALLLRPDILPHSPHLSGGKLEDFVRGQ